MTVPDCVTVSCFHSTPSRRGQVGSFYVIDLNASSSGRYLRPFDRVVVSTPTEHGPVEGRPKLNAPSVEVMPRGERRGTLRHLVGHAQLRKQEREALLRHDDVQRSRDEHLEGRADHYSKLWTLYVLHKWAEVSL